jgi:phosphoglycerate kinase
MGIRTLDDVDPGGQRVLVRVDFNVPVEDGRITDDTRLRAALPTIHELRARSARVVLLSHFGRPKGEPDEALSLRFLTGPLSELIGAPVAFSGDCVGEAAIDAERALGNGDVLLLENLRFHSGEEANDHEFARELAILGDLYVDDAFSTAHRAHASTEGVARILPACAGRAMQTELEHLERALGSPERPVMGIVGGAKVSTKLDLLDNLVGKLQRLAIGGGMANTFLYAQGHRVGASLCEKDLADTARKILEDAEARGCEIILPSDVVVARKLQSYADCRTTDLDGIADDESIFDMGPSSVRRVLDAIAASRTLVWNGPLGVFEVPPFDKGTVAAARQAAKLAKAGKLVAVGGGGDTVAALNLAGAADDFTYVSMAGGAFLEWMEGKTLPGVAALEMS